MANKLPQKKIDEMWTAWQEKQTLYNVRAKCKVSYPTISRYRKLERWDERLAKIREKTIQKVDAKQVNHNAKYVKIANAVINVFAQSLLGYTEEKCSNCGIMVRVAIPRPDVSPADFDRMVRLIRLELGEVEKREERKIEVIYR